MSFPMLGSVYIFVQYELLIPLQTNEKQVEVKVAKRCEKRASAKFIDYYKKGAWEIVRADQTNPLLREKLDKTIPNRRH